MTRGPVRVVRAGFREFHGAAGGSIDSQGA